MSNATTAFQRKGICHETESGNSPSASRIKNSRVKTNRIAADYITLVVEVRFSLGTPEGWRFSPSVGGKTPGLMQLISCLSAQTVSRRGIFLMRVEVIK